MLSGCYSLVDKVNDWWLAFHELEPITDEVPPFKGATHVKLPSSCQMNSLAASVKLTYSASMVDRLTDFCLKVRHEIGVPSIKVMNPPIDTRSSLFVAKSESE
ncbi:hypothetical protein TNCV_5097241 [Trichonephila clavipes]|nr:hypothetical protein TNCV_5097241 [Trichonephila clavipes]